MRNYNQYQKLKIKNKKHKLKYVKTSILVFGYVFFIFGLLFFILAGGWSFPDEVGAMGAPVPPGKPLGLLIDDFEDWNYSANPEWWTFDNISPEAVNNLSLPIGDAQIIREIGNYSLKISGTTKTEWYAGGMGCYIAKPRQDLSPYRNFQLDIYGYGPGQGTLKIELFDDDNNNWEIEQNTMEAYVPIYDDRFVAEVRVDWMGWRRVVIPFSDFIDDNPGAGDGLWNPAQTGQSGGLLQFQFICISSRKIGTLQYVVDNIRLTK